jgi:hypothetical protein
MADRTLGNLPVMPVLPSSNQRLMSSGDIYQELGPNYSSQELLVTAALRTAMVPGQELVADVRPRIATLGLPFPPRWGFPSYQDRQSGIDQVLDAQRVFQTRRYDLSGGVAGWQGAARNVGVEDVW